MPNSAHSTPNIIAAVDLGSNSFHLQISRVVGDGLYTLDSLKETVRLGSGVTEDRTIDPVVAVHALEVLKLFAERLRGMPAEAVRAVGTNAFRVAKNAQSFLREAESTLGYPIEIIAGREEARLIYLGVAHHLPLVNHNRLVVDIGGGSTEFIVGHKLKPKLVESLYMGCVSYTERYFVNGKLDKKSFKQAELFARRELESISARFHKEGWKEVFGSSGTAKTLSTLLVDNAISTGDITRKGLEWLKEWAIETGELKKLAVTSIKEDRLPVFPGGLAIMLAVFEELAIESMQMADSALREGVLYDLLGRTHHEDIRDMTVQSFTRLHHVDTAQADRVESLALRFFGELQDSQSVGNEIVHYRRKQMLRWVARLHEIGINVAQGAFHKHSAYIIANADLPGFSRSEQKRLAALALGSRGKLSKLEIDFAVDQEYLTLIFCLRLAVLLSRSRRNIATHFLHVEYGKNGFVLRVDGKWLASHSLTEFSLKAEAKEWEARSIGFEIAEK